MYRQTVQNDRAARESGKSERGQMPAHLFSSVKFARQVSPPRCLAGSGKGRHGWRSAGGAGRPGGMAELTNPKWIYLKGFLFLVAGSMAAGILILDQPEIKTIVLLAIAIWSFARFYYFAFYVIEHYVDPGYPHAGGGVYDAPGQSMVGAAPVHERCRGPTRSVAFGSELGVGGEAVTHPVLKGVLSVIAFGDALAVAEAPIHRGTTRSTRPRLGGSGCTRTRSPGAPYPAPA